MHAPSILLASPAPARQACPGRGVTAGRQHVRIRMAPHVVQRRVAKYVCGLAQIVHGVAPAQPHAASAEGPGSQYQLHLSGGGTSQHACVTRKHGPRNLGWQLRLAGYLWEGETSHREGMRSLCPACLATQVIHVVSKSAHHSWYSTVVRGRLGSDMSLNTSTKGTSRMAACAALARELAKDDVTCAFVSHGLCSRSSKSGVHGQVCRSCASSTRTYLPGVAEPRCHQQGTLDARRQNLHATLRSVVAPRMSALEAV